MWARRAAMAGVLVLLMASVASAQTRGRQATRGSEPATKVHRMDVYNGPRLTVAYFGRNVTPADRALLRELAQAQSDPLPVVVVPVAAETLLAPPVFVDRVAPIAAMAMDRVATVAAEDPFVARETRRLLALARVAGSPRLRQAFGWEDEAVATPVVAAAAKSVVKPAAAESEEDDPVPATILTTRDGKRIACSAVEESGAWVLATTTGGKKLRLRPADVVRIEEAGRR